VQTSIGISGFFFVKLLLRHLYRTMGFWLAVLALVLARGGGADVCMEE